MNALRVIAPQVVSCVVPKDLPAARRTAIARTVIGAARAYAARGRTIDSPAGIASTIINRRLRASEPELRAIEARDVAEAERLDLGGSIEVGAAHLARVLGASLTPPVREAAHEVIGHAVGAHDGDCAICATFHRAQQEAAAWQELLSMTNVSPRLAADLAGAIAAAGYITATRKQPALREDDF